jgi:RNA polymerase sigma-70 factor (ECF subfamily)
MTFLNEDKDIIRKIRKGDLFEFEKLFNKYYNRLCHYAENYLKEPALAEEIVSELFLKIWGKRQSLEIDTSLKSYLFRSVHNNCLKYLEHLKVLKKYETFASSMIENREQIQSMNHHYPLANLISREIEAEIQAAVNNLPDKCKEIFCMHRFDDLSYEEIAVKLGISINTVRTHMLRALQKLRESLKEYLPKDVRKNNTGQS